MQTITATGRPNSFSRPLANAPQPRRRPRRDKAGGFMMPATFAYVSLAEWFELLAHFKARFHDDDCGDSLVEIVMRRFIVID